MKNGKKGFNQVKRLVLLSDQDIGPYESSPKDIETLRSSFDYIDVDMKKAMNAVGEKVHSGRATNFFKKDFREDHLHKQDDESLIENHLHMPDVGKNE